jgi:hypothetical protein
MLILLLGQGGGSLRLAAVLALVCVVLIGFSVALRNDARAIRAQVEAMVLDEVDALREENREDIVAVARKLHSTLREEAADLADQIEELRARGATARPSQDAAGFGRDLVRAEAAPQWRQGTVTPDEAGHRGNGTARSAAAVPVSGLPQRSAWSEASDWRDHAPQPAVTGRATIQPPSPRTGSHDDYPGTTSRWDPLTGSPNGARGDRTGRSPGVPVSPVSPGPVSGGPVSPGPIPPGPTFGVPGTGWQAPNGNGTTYSRSSGGGGYPDHVDRQNGSTYPSGNTYPSGDTYSSGNTYRSGDLNGGRRRAPEPEAPAPRAAIESGGRSADPWADLRGEPGTADSYHSEGSRGREYGPAGHPNHGGAPVSSGGYRQPAPDRDWRDPYR